MANALREAPLAADLDSQLTGDRNEVKFLVPQGALHALVKALDLRIAAHRFHGEGANPLPYAQHFITTAYLDTPSRAHYRAALENVEHNVKVRAREYYDVNPALAELATSPEQLLHHQPWIWLEVKRRDGRRTLKSRTRLPKRDVPTLFPGTLDRGALGGVDPFADLEANTQGDAALHDIAQHCRSLGEPLTPACLANYQRLSWQSTESPLRLTLDLDLAFFAPKPDLWQHDQVLQRELLGVVYGRSQEAVLEIKYRGGLPAWLESTLEQGSLRPVRHSKFVLASKAVYGA